MMTSRRTFVTSMLTLAAVPLLSNGQTCAAAAKTDNKDSSPSTGPKLNATGAAVLGGCPKKTKIKIKCGKCGHQPAEIEIDTPTADKPYSQEWTCPKCGNKQKVTVEIVKPE